MVALSIDDGPSPYTADILDLLKEYNAHATFFCIGEHIRNIPESAQLLTRMVAQGHEIGNHAMRDEASILLPIQILRRQLLETNSMLPPLADSHSRLFRPGCGWFNTRMLNLVKELNMHLVLGDIYPHDAQIQWPWLNSKRVIHFVHPGAIIIIHDNRSWSPKQVRLILQGLRVRNWDVVTVSDLVFAALA